MNNIIMKLCHGREIESFLLFISCTFAVALASRRHFCLFPLIYARVLRAKEWINWALFRAKGVFPISAFYLSDSRYSTNILSTYFFDLKSFSFGVQSSRKLNSTSKKSGLVIIISIRLGGIVYAGFLMCK